MCVIVGDFGRSEVLVTVGFSEGHFRLVVQAPDDPRRDRALGHGSIQDQLPVVANR